MLAPLLVAAVAASAASAADVSSRVPAKRIAAHPPPSEEEIQATVGEVAEDVIELLERHAPKPPERGPFHPVVGAARDGEQAGRYGAPRGGRIHEGQDVFAPAGTPLIAVRDGVVVETGNDGGRGNYLALYVPARRETYNYLHMLAPTPLKVGERVRAGELVGRVGCTGSCWGDHLHFEIRAGRGANGATSDPLPQLARWERRRAPVSG